MSLEAERAARGLDWAMAAIAVQLLLVLGVVWQPAIPPVMAALGAALTWRYASRATADAVCVRLVLGAYCLKVLVTAFLYLASSHQWPLVAGLEHGGNGFWAFADDAQAHHNYGSQLAHAWQGAAPLPSIDFSNWTFVVYVASVYTVLGPHPLHISLLNAWYGTVMVLAGLLLLRQLGASTASTRCAVVLLGFWPSLLLWSSQSLKEPLLLALMMLGFSSAVRLVGEVQEGRLRWADAGSLVVWLCLLSLFRGYASVTLVAATLTACGYAAIRATRQRTAPRLDLRLPVLVILLPLVLLVSARVNLQQLAARPLVSSSHQPSSQPSKSPGSDSSLSSASHQPSSKTSELPEPASSVSSKLRSLVQFWQGTLGRVTPSALGRLRQGFVLSGGHALVDPTVKIRNAAEALWYLPRGISVALLAPFPWQWWDTAGRTSVLHVFSAIEVLFIYWLLLPGAVWLGSRIRRSLARRQAAQFLTPQTAFLWLFIALIGIPMALTVANLGTLFRLRLQFLLPMALLISLGDPLGCYRNGLHHLQQRALALWKALSHRQAAA